MGQKSTCCCHRRALHAIIPLCPRAARAFLRCPHTRMNSGRSKRVRPHEGLLLGEQMKGYEDETCSAIADLSRPCVIRLDGHCFHTFTRGFRRPYDERIHRAMVATATDLLERFGAATVRSLPRRDCLLQLATIPRACAHTHAGLHRVRRDFATLPAEPARYSFAPLQRARAEGSLRHGRLRVGALQQAHLRTELRGTG